MILQLLLILCLVLIILAAYFRYNRVGRLMSKIPGPPRIPIFGHIIILHKTSESLYQHLRSWHKTYGRLWKLDGLHLRAVNIYHPEDVELLLFNSIYNNKGMPYTFLKGWLGEGLLVSNGDIWHQRRKMLTPAFHFRSLNKYFNIFCAHTQSLLHTIENELDKEYIDIVPLMSKTSLAVMCETALGAKVQEMSSINSYLQSIHKLGECYVNRLITPEYMINNFYKLSCTARREKSLIKDVHNYTKNIIQRRRRNRNENNAGNIQENNLNEVKPMLDILLDEEAKGTIDDTGIRNEVDTFLFEGHDTTATALTFMIMRIANEPEIQDSIYEELQDIFGDSQRSPTVEDLTKMKYLECCIKESLRLYPSVPFLSRFIIKDIVLAGRTVPKDTMVHVHVFDIHRNPDVYPEPEKFRPERFLPENTVGRNPYSYIPFSAGPRNCIGQKYAMMKMKTLMSGLIWKYRLEPVTKPEDLVFILDMVLRTNHPIYVRFRPRENLP
ncbi:hypothetical protein PYW08_002373 [Mythimna loreyi]|uniref:Uncharacterized protein n=1 Tax=Mythimna loreyi TaxID=667449 RepID=A0ACC2R487_9NEOP|nr:hypothetical protein PYW08_002373 [Mythimna loreyi]